MTLNADVLDLLAKWESDGRNVSPEEICQDSPHLLPELQRCIARLSSIDRLLASPDHDEPAVPSIDGYAIERPIGRGGMGIVWGAVQLSTKRQVALKLISAGEFASARARVRFEREVELASRLNHPNIARVYDSGLHTGLFYYAMELVEGLPLDRYVQSQQLTRRQILELMLPICAAVHHAHQLGVIHRDLKPSNILVDQQGNPHLLDFGLAKEVLSETSPQTTLEDAPGTPAYMSPEQASGQYKRVGTASDVYTLGVILYLLLLKQYPHDVEGTSIQTMQRIATQEPARPRAVDPHFPRDLDAILLKALAREPEQRYSSADALARDLARWLDGLPCAPLGRRYFATKFIRRHKYKLAIAATMTAIVLGVSIVAYFNIAHQRDRAETEAQISRAVNDFLLNMLASADPEAAGEPVPTLPELLDRASERIDGAFPDQPLVEAAIRSTIGRTYVLLALAWKSEPHLRRAHELRAKHLGPSHPDTLATVGELALCLYNDDRHVEAEELLRPAIDAARKHPGIEDDRTLSLLNHLVATLYYQMLHSEAEELAREIYQTNLRVHGPDDLRTLIAAEDFATALIGVGNYVEAEKLIHDAMARCPADPKIRLPRMCHSLLRLGGIHAAQDRLPEAEAAYTRCVNARIELYGDHHNMVAYAKLKLANVKERLGKFTEAEQLVLDAIEIDASERPDSTAVVETYMTGVRIYHAMGKPDAAADLIEKAKRVVEARLLSDEPPDPKLIYAYGNSLVRMGMHQQAADYLGRAVQISTPRLRPGHAGLRRIVDLLDRARAASTQPTTSPASP